MPSGACHTGQQMDLQQMHTPLESRLPPKHAWLASLQRGTALCEVPTGCCQSGGGREGVKLIAELGLELRVIASMNLSRSPLAPAASALQILIRLRVCKACCEVWSVQFCFHNPISVRACIHDATVKHEAAEAPKLRETGDNHSFRETRWWEGGGNAQSSGAQPEHSQPQTLEQGEPGIASKPA